ncbi:MAG: outer membrane protein assembly factor [Flavobacteriaceae bacterium]|nr:outer membrane protein assembly factor [Flavobacteriaceae bacterium]
MPKFFTKILFFALTLTYLVSCNSTKYVAEDEMLLKKNVIYVNERKNRKEDLNRFLVQKPNQSILGIPLTLNFYNFGNPDFEKTFEEWSANNLKKYETYERIFSYKQSKVIYNTGKGFNNWFLNKGQAPIIYNEERTKRSAKSLTDVFHSRGFFDAEVAFDPKQIKDKEIAVDYKITTNNQYYIDSVSTEIESTVLDSIYQLQRQNAIIKKGNPFVFDDFEQEENRLVTLFRNSGIYHFKKNSMGFYTDSVKGVYKKDVLLKIPDRIVRVNDSVFKVPYKVQNVTEVNVYTDFEIKNRGLKPKDSVKYNGYNFYSYGKMHFKPKHLVNSLFITPNSYFKNAERNLTRNHLRKLKTFSSSIDINYTENNDDSLTADIYLTPLKKFALTFDLDATHSNNKPFGILGKSSLLGRNIFKGSETLELAFQGSFLNVSNDAANSSKFFNAWEFISSASLKFPRILFPISTNSIIPKHMVPETSVDMSVSIQKNIGLDRQAITGGIGYSWKSSKAIGHRLDLVNLQYIKNQNIDNYFKIYDSEYEKLNDIYLKYNIGGGESLPKENDEILDFIDFTLDPVNDFENQYPEDYDIVSDVNERRDILIENVMVPVIAYSFVYNSRENVKDSNFSYFTARFVSSGALSTIISSNENEEGQNLMFGLPIAQYFKTEFEYKKYWELRKNNILIFRTFAGAAFPYNKSTNIPFSRSYSAGGSNEIRAWRTYDLGPGAESNNLEFNVATFKLVSNLEYRFQLTSKIHSALFIDAGNIWDITDSNLISDEGKLTGFNSLKNTAVGSGIGIRYDFGFLVFRFDTGFKTYEPYLTSNNKWFVNYNFNRAVYNIGINYPF